jgi:hypothetical protein
MDAFCALAANPIKLADLDSLRYSPFLWAVGLFLPLMKVLTSLPPGALVVVSLPQNTTSTVNVPTFDPNFRGNKTAPDFFANALFVMGFDGEYR